MNQQNTSSSGTSQKPPFTVNQQSFQLPVQSGLTNSGIQPSNSSQGSVVQGFNQHDNYGAMRKRHCSNTSGVHQSGQYGNPAINQNYQQVQPQVVQMVSQPQQVYRPSYILNQSANMTSDQSGGYSNQVNTAQWLQSNIGSTNQVYQTGQTFQQNCLPASTALPNYYQSLLLAAQQNAQNLRSTAYFALRNLHQNQASISSNPHNFPTNLFPTNVNRFAQPSSGEQQSTSQDQPKTDVQGTNSQV